MVCSPCPPSYSSCAPHPVWERLLDKNSNSLQHLGFDLLSTGPRTVWNHVYLHILESFPDVFMEAMGEEGHDG